MSKHFEELWEQCEQFHKETSGSDKNSSLLEEIIMKLNLYKIVDNRQDLSEQEKTSLKEFTLGEVLLTLTNLSLTENIDVYKALSTAFQYKSIIVYNEKYSKK